MIVLPKHIPASRKIREIFQIKAWKKQIHKPQLINCMMSLSSLVRNSIYTIINILWAHNCTKRERERIARDAGVSAHSPRWVRHSRRMKSSASFSVCKRGKTFFFFCTLTLTHVQFPSPVLALKESLINGSSSVIPLLLLPSFVEGRGQRAHRAHEEMKQTSQERPKTEKFAEPS